MSVKIRERPRASGIWWVFMDHLGKRKAKKIGRDIRIAQEVARIIEAKIVLGELNLDRTEKSKIPTLKEYVDGWHEPDESYQIRWYEKEARLSLKNSTFRSYRSIIDYHLLPAIGSIPINEITPRIISDFIRSKIKGGLRSNSAKNIKNCLSAILRHAVNPDGFLMANPARSIPVPKPEGEKALREPDPFTWDERKVFENLMWNTTPAITP